MLPGKFLNHGHCEDGDRLPKSTLHVFGQAERRVFVQPVSWVIWLHDRPVRLSVTWTLGRPSRLPFTLAFRNPAFTRSTIRLRSSSATELLIEVEQS